MGYSSAEDTSSSRILHKIHRIQRKGVLLICSSVSHNSEPNCAKIVLSPSGERQISTNLVLDRFTVKDRFLSLIDLPPSKLIERHHIVRVIHIEQAEYTREIFRVPAHPGPYTALCI